MHRERNRKGEGDRGGDRQKKEEHKKKTNWPKKGT